jgi:hypothetical protein
VDRVYEIQCLTKGLTFTNAPAAVGNSYSFEACIQYCNDNAVTCNWSAVWTKSTTAFGSCQIATGYVVSNPPGKAVGALVSNLQRFAKLNSSLINDAVYFIPRKPDGDLGFCKGPNSKNYDRAFIALQYVYGSYSFSNQIHQIACGAYSWYGTGGRISILLLWLGTPEVASPTQRLKIVRVYATTTTKRTQARDAKLGNSLTLVSVKCIPSVREALLPHPLSGPVFLWPVFVLVAQHRLLLRITNAMWTLSLLVVRPSYLRIGVQWGGSQA